MRLPFSSKKTSETADSSRRSSFSDDGPQEQSKADDNVSGQRNATPTFTPATSYSSTNTTPISTTDREGRKTGMYKLSGNIFSSKLVADWLSR
jgi:hypothetical protein